MHLWRGVRPARFSCGFHGASQAPSEREPIRLVHCAAPARAPQHIQTGPRADRATFLSHTETASYRRPGKAPGFPRQDHSTPFISHPRDVKSTRPTTRCTQPRPLGPPALSTSICQLRTSSEASTPACSSTVCELGPQGQPAELKTPHSVRPHVSGLTPSAPSARSGPTPSCGSPSKTEVSTYFS